jgi:Immunoglobulin-like domain of bacterial spore germination/Sporulation and spore germination
VVATAATVAAVAALGGNPQPTAQDPGPAASQSSSEPSDGPTPTDETQGGEPTEPAEETTPPEQPATSALPAYFVRDTPQGPRLTREFSTVAGDVVPEKDAVTLAVSGRALDPDYRTLWPDGSRALTVTSSGDAITVDLTGDGLSDRPTGMSQEEAELAVQQVVYTAQAVVQQGRIPVQITLDGAVTDQVLGVPASEPFSNASENETLALVGISSLSEGETVRDRFVVSGVANSFEATVPWEVRQGDKVVARGSATAEGWMDKLYPWTTTVNVSKLPSGTYTFAAMTDDPTGGAEGAGPTEDTKTIVVK